MTQVDAPVGLPVCAADPFDDAHLLDPAALHEQLREAGPVVHLTHYDVFGMARYTDVHAALRDFDAFCSRAGVGITHFGHEKPWRPPSLLLEADPPAHDAPRAVLSRLLSPRVIARLGEQWDADAVALVEQVLAGDDVIDAVPALAAAFPLRVFPDAVGLPADGREPLLPYGELVFNAFGPRNQLLLERLEELPRLAAWVTEQCRREVLRPDGLGAGIWAAAEAGEIRMDQAGLVVRSLLSAGVDTTVHGLSALLHAFSVHPDQWTLLRERPELLRFAFEETIRWASPVQRMFRTTTREVEVSGSTIPADCKVLMFLGAANHDPRQWTDPQRFDITRNASGHVGFGMGIHHCVGQHIARAEAVALIGAMLPRVARIEPAGPAVRHPNNSLSSWRSLPLRLIPA